MTDEEVLEKLRDILGLNGTLSDLIIDETEICPSSSAFQSRFGSLLREWSPGA